MDNNNMPMDIDMSMDNNMHTEMTWAWTCATWLHAYIKLVDAISDTLVGRGSLDAELNGIPHLPLKGIAVLSKELIVLHDHPYTLSLIGK